MAKIVYGPIAGAVSGALGNTVFSHNRHGAYVRVRTIPTKVVNSYTVGVRDVLASASRGWGGLAAEEQSAWNTWAEANPITDRLGQKRALFGNAAYVMLNARLMQAGDTPIALPPVIAAPEPLTSLSLAAGEGAGTVILTTAPTPLGANYRLMVWLAVLINPGQNYFKNLLKLMTITAKNVPTGEDIAPFVEARFGAITEGHRYVLKAVVLDSTTGLISGPKLALATVAA